MNSIDRLEKAKQAMCDELERAETDESHPMYQIQKAMAEEDFVRAFSLLPEELPGEAEAWMYLRLHLKGRLEELVIIAHIKKMLEAEKPTKTALINLVANYMYQLGATGKMMEYYEEEIEIQDIALGFACDLYPDLQEKIKTCPGFEEMKRRRLAQVSKRKEGIGKALQQTHASAIHAKAFAQSSKGGSHKREASADEWEVIKGYWIRWQRGEITYRNKTEFDRCMVKEFDSEERARENIDRYPASQLWGQTRKITSARMVEKKRKEWEEELNNGLIVL